MVVRYLKRTLKTHFQGTTLPAEFLAFRQGEASHELFLKGFGDHAELFVLKLGGHEKQLANCCQSRMIFEISINLASPVIVCKW